MGELDYHDFVPDNADTLELYGEAYVFNDSEVNGSAPFEHPPDSIGIHGVLLLLAFAAIFGIGVVGNSLVVHVIRKNPGLRTVTNLYLISLAVANLFYLILSVPFITTAYGMGTWPFGSFLCGFTGYARGVTMAVSVLTLTAIAIDSYVAILHPVRSRPYRSLRSTMIVILAIWVISLAATIYVPFMYEVQTVLGRQSLLKQCSLTAWSASRRLTRTVCVFVLLYILPQTVVAVCYFRIARRLWVSPRSTEGGQNVVSVRELRARRRLVGRICLITVAFAVGWLPVHVMALYKHSHPQDARHIYTREILTLYFSFGVNAINPLIYCLRSASHLFLEALTRPSTSRARPPSFEVRSRFALSPRSDVINMASLPDKQPLQVSTSESNSSTSNNTCNNNSESLFVGSGLKELK